jgi:3-phosphoshikimate 1-carboxyvinyltransferase
VEAKTRYEVNSTGGWTETPTFETYDDHRMAMAFAPLGMMSDVIIEEPGVVAKSYPSYWEDLGKIVSLEELN